MGRSQIRDGGLDCRQATHTKSLQSSRNPVGRFRPSRRRETYFSLGSAGGRMVTQKKYFSRTYHGQVHFKLKARERERHLVAFNDVYNAAAMTQNRLTSVNSRSYVLRSTFHQTKHFLLFSLSTVSVGRFLI